MRTSCNGCRVLRKGCSDDCTIRPCLQWIKSPDSQAQATLFLAKFYGRTGLLNLIDAGPQYLRPAVFKSLLYEACGRIVNPVYGSVGLLWSGEWAKCQAAVEAVLAGMPITGDGDGAALEPKNLLKSSDIRHVAKDTPEARESADQKLNQVGVKTRNGFKSASAKQRSLVVGSDQSHDESGSGGSIDVADFTRFLNPGHEYYLWTTPQGIKGTSGEDRESMFSVKTVEASLALRNEPSRAGAGEVGLELTLGSLG